MGTNNAILLDSTQALPLIYRPATTGLAANVLDLNAERTRLSKEQADKVEMENHRMRGELVSVSVARQVLEKILAAFRSRVRCLST